MSTRVYHTMICKNVYCSERRISQSFSHSQFKSLIRQTVINHNFWEYIKPGQRKIGYIGWLGHKNLGDYAMFKAFKQLFSSFDVIDHSWYVELDVPKKSCSSMLDAVFLGGGTFINREEGILREFENVIANGLPSFVFGTGVCNPEFWRLTKDWRDRIERWCDCIHKCNSIGVRGPISKEILQEHGVQNVGVIGDIALSLSNADIRSKNLKRHIGINIGGSGGRVWGNEESILDFVVKASRILIEKGWKLTFVPVYPPDIAYIEKAVNMIHNSEVGIFRGFHSIDKTLRMLESLDVFIGEKLHSVVLSIAVYTPSIMLEYRPKCRDFMASMGLDEFNMRTDMLSLERLEYLVEKLYDNIRRYQDRIIKQVEYYRKKQKESAINIINTLC